MEKECVNDNGGSYREAEMIINSPSKKTVKTLKKKNKFYDFNTSNKSFLEMFKILNLLGVKNNKFFLRIFDKDLIGIDPYSPFLPVEVQLKIIFECMINPWYFLREVARIPEDGLPIKPGGGVQFRLDRNNLASWYLTLNHIPHYDSKPRQQGKTQSILSQINYAFHFGTQNSEIVFFNKKSPDCELNLARLKIQRDLLPMYMQMRVAFSDEQDRYIKETANVKSMFNPITKNKIITTPSAVRETDAQSLARGHTNAISFHDEFDFSKHNITILTNAAPGYKTAASNAEKNGAMYCRIFSSTPGNLDDKEGADATILVSNMFKWTEEWFDRPIKELKKELSIPKKNNGIVLVEHTWQQLGLSEEWYESQCKDCLYDKAKIAREIDLKRIRGSKDSPFKEEQLYFLQNNIKRPIEKISIMNFEIPLYEKIHRTYGYIMGVDPSEGIGGDNSAFTLLSPYTRKVVAEFKCNYISPSDFAKLIVKFLDIYCKKILIVVESNRSEVLHRLMETKYLPNLYYDEDNMASRPSARMNEYGTLSNRVIKNPSYGFLTSSKTRPLLIAKLFELINEEIRNFETEFLINDICSLVRTSTGRIEAGNGFHDDNVISFLLAIFVFDTASNLDKYGFYRGMTPPKEIDYSNPKDALEDIKRKIEMLPDEMKQLFPSFTKGGPETTSYYKLLEEENKKMRIQSTITLKPEEREIDTDITKVHEYLDSNLLESDYYSNNHDDDVDIDDWV